MGGSRGAGGPPGIKTLNIDQILTKNVKNVKIHVGNFQGRHFLRKKASAGTLHNIAQGGGGYRGIGEGGRGAYIYNIYDDHESM